MLIPRLTKLLVCHESAWPVSSWTFIPMKWFFGNGCAPTNFRLGATSNNFFFMFFHIVRWSPLLHWAVLFITVHIRGRLWGWYATLSDLGERDSPTLFFYKKYSYFLIKPLRCSVLLLFAAFALNFYSIHCQFLIPRIHKQGYYSFVACIVYNVCIHIIFQQI